MTKFAFNDRASYKAYRAEWKNRYLTTTSEIRKLKQERAEANRAFSKTDGSYNKEWSALANTLHALATARKNATELLIELSEAKEEAQRQYQPAKEAAMS